MKKLIIKMLAMIAVFFSSSSNAALFINTSNLINNVAALNGVSEDQVSRTSVSFQNLVDQAYCCDTGYSDRYFPLRYSNVVGANVRLSQPDGYYFRWNDPNGGSAWDQVLSIGLIDLLENDDFIFNFDTHNVYGFGLNVFSNTPTSGERIYITLWDNSSWDIPTSDIWSSSGDVDNYSFVSTGSPIKRIVFDESADGDDIGITGFQVTTIASVTAVPLPAGVWLFLSAVGGLASMHFKRNR